MSLRHELICKIAAETETAEHMRRDRKLSSKTVFKIYEIIGLGEAGWGYDKTREDYLREILEFIGHDERKNMYGSSTPVSTSGLQSILDALQEPSEEQSSDSKSAALKAPNMLQRIYT